MHVAFSRLFQSVNVLKISLVVYWDHIWLFCCHNMTLIQIQIVLIL